MYHLIQYLNPCRKVDANIVTMHGNIANSNPNFAVRNLVRRAAMAFGGRNVSILAQGLCPSAEKLARIQEEPKCKNIFAIFERINLSVSGVGCLYPVADSPLFTTNYLSEAEVASLTVAGAYSDILLRFIDKNGHECKTSLAERTLSISLDTYRKIPCKVVVASGSKKAHSVHALLMGDLADVLVIDYYLAERILQL